MTDDGFEVDDILANLEKKQAKKKNTSKDKGNRGENALADVLEKRFPGKKFFRVTGSGNRWSQVDLPKEYEGVFAGDIVCPSDFGFCLECKYGYADIEMCGLFAKPHPKITGWLEKVVKDSRGEKEPMLCWRKPYQPWLAFTRLALDAPVAMRLGDWTVTALDWLLAKPDAFWYK